MSWRQAMQILADDASRLCLLDWSCSVRVGLVQFCDDLKQAGSSWGALSESARALGLAVGRMRGLLKFGQGKSAYRQQGFLMRTPVEVGGGAVPEVSSHVSLGVPLDCDAGMGCLLRRVEVRGHECGRSTLATILMAGLPLSAVLCAFQLRVQPAVLYGAEFLLVRPDWARRLNALGPSYP